MTAFTPGTRVDGASHLMAHVGDGILATPDGVLLVVLGLAAVGSALVVGLAVVALSRRRSWPYLLVTLALATVLTRTFLGALTMGGTLTLGGHHTMEHALDVVMIALLLGAVYRARTVEPRPEDDAYD